MLTLRTSWRCLDRLCRLWEISLWLLCLILVISNYCTVLHNCLSELCVSFEIPWAVTVSLRNSVLYFWSMNHLTRWGYPLSCTINVYRFCLTWTCRTWSHIGSGQGKRQNEDLQLPPASKYYVFLGRSTSSQHHPRAAEGNPFRAVSFTSKALGVRPSLLYVPQVSVIGIYWSRFSAAYTWS